MNTIYIILTETNTTLLMIKMYCTLIDQNMNIQLELIQYLMITLFCTNKHKYLTEEIKIIIPRTEQTGIKDMTWTESEI